MPRLIKVIDNLWRTSGQKKSGFRFSLPVYFLLICHISSASRHIVNVYPSTSVSMYSKCYFACILAKNPRQILRQETLLSLFSNYIISLQLSLPLYFIISIIDSYCQHKIELKRWCNCLSMICFRAGQQQMLTNGMLVNITDHGCSNYIHFNHVHF